VTWWSWILIWMLLVIAALAVLALFLVSYWRKGRVLLRQLEELTAKLDEIQPDGDAPEAQRPPSSLFADRNAVRRAHEKRRDSRRDRSEDRRSARVERGKLLVHRNRQAK
jgi:biopolymer transport protein ExbB/TolQ